MGVLRPDVAVVNLNRALGDGESQAHATGGQAVVSNTFTTDNDDYRALSAPISEIRLIRAAVGYSSADKLAARRCCFRTLSSGVHLEPHVHEDRASPGHGTPHGLALGMRHEMA